MRLSMNVGQALGMKLLYLAGYIITALLFLLSLIFALLFMLHAGSFLWVAASVGLALLLRVALKRLLDLFHRVSIRPDTLR
jgi:hypothetical protein